MIEHINMRYGICSNGGVNRWMNSTYFSTQPEHKQLGVLFCNLCFIRRAKARILLGDASGSASLAFSHS